MVFPDGDSLTASNQSRETQAFLRATGRDKPERVHIWDETLRDGEQSPGVHFTIGEKLAIAKLLDEAGVSIIDAGFPVVSADERAAIKKIASEGLRADIGVTVRALRTDIDSALSCDVSEVHMFLPTSRLHLHHKMGLEEEEALNRAVKATEYAKSHGLVVDFIAEDATRTEPGFLHNFYSALIAAGADRLMLTDTVGVMSPEAMFRFSADTMDALSNDGEDYDTVEFAVHCHNDFGLAVANTASAVLAGATHPTVTVNGIGERAGNAAFEEVVLSLEKLYGIRTGIRLELISEICDLVERSSGMFLQPHKPVNGFNAFRHESGIHVDGVLQHVGTYEPIQPDEVGSERSFVLGKHSGSNLVAALLAEKNLDASKQHVRVISDRIKMLKESGDKSSLVEMAHRLQEYRNTSLGFPEEDFWRVARQVLAGDRTQSDQADIVEQKKALVLP